MATIAKIEQQKGNRERYNLYIDTGKDITFLTGVHEDILIQFSLQKGMAIDQNEIEEIITQDHIKKGFNKCLRYLSHRMRTTLELQTYLYRNEYEEPHVQVIIDKLKSYGYVNDEEYAITYIKEQIRSGKKGPIVITQELKRKGISAELIDSAITSYHYELQLDNAIQLIQGKASTNQRKSTLELKKSFSQMLQTKGFSWDIVDTAVKSVCHDVQDQNQQALLYQGKKAHRKFSNLPASEYERKMKQCLYRKGFSEEDINRLLRDLVTDLDVLDES